MAVAFKSSYFSAGASSGTTITLTPSTTAGSLIVLIVACKATSLTVSGIADNASGGSNVYTSCGANSVDTSNYRTEVWYAANAKATTSIVVTMSGTITDGNVAMLEYTGAATSTPFDVATTGAGASGTTWNTGSFTPTASGETVVCFAIDAAGVGNQSPATNYTQRDNGNGSGAKLCGEDYIGAPAGSQTAGWTSDTSTTWQVVAAVFSTVNITIPTPGISILQFGIGV